MAQKQNIPQQVVIVGGGISGLSAAWELQKTRGDIQVTLLESSARWGGKMHSEQVSGPNGETFTIDAGPDAFISRKPELWDLAQELGLADEIIDPGSETRGMYVLENGAPVAIPLSPFKFLRSPLLSARGKLRLLAEPFVAPKRDEEDESLAQFADRRLGREARQKLIGPILAGIYNTDPERQSILTTSPIMREMEKEAGSLFRAAFQRMRAARRERANGKARPRFFTFKGGAQVVVDALVSQLEAGLHLNTAVRAIEPMEDGYRLVSEKGERFSAQAILLATPANVGAQLLASAAPEAAGGLSRIRHSHIGTISLAYKASDLPAAGEINGLMIPRREARFIDAVSFTSRKQPERAPRGYILLRVFFGGSRPEVAKLEDHALISLVRRELAELLNIHAEPVAAWPFRWLDSFPQADVGHLDLVNAIEAKLPNGIFLAGSSYRGIGVPDCVRQGIEAAQRLKGYLSQQTESVQISSA